MTDFASLFRRLTQHNIEFILVGGAAATRAHPPRFTTTGPTIPLQTELTLIELESSLFLFLISSPEGKSERPCPTRQP